jgi:putative ABC transport system permease protein
MRNIDTLAFGWKALVGYPARTWLTLLAMAIGVAAVVVLTALGEAARRYVVDEFSNLGTHLLIVLPGRNETTGGAPPMLGITPRDLTLRDALAIGRNSEVELVAPISVGSAPVAHGNLDRESTIVGSTAELLPVRRLQMAEGGFLPAGKPELARPVVVLGATLKQELFGNDRALGRWVRIGDRRFRVIGVLSKRGESLGLDMSEVAIVPVASAQALFNSPALFRVLVQARSTDALGGAKDVILNTIRRRHEGEDDITVITQDALLSTFDGILRALTYAVAGIAAVSLLVAGVLIMNVMLVSVSQRTAEIGLLKAIGSPEKQILRLFLVEAGLLSILGALLGMIIAYLSIWGMNQALPDFALHAPSWALGAAIGVALLTGLLFGVLPARRAARLDPVTALSGR